MDKIILLLYIFCKNKKWNLQSLMLFILTKISVTQKLLLKQKNSFFYSFVYQFLQLSHGSKKWKLALPSPGFDDLLKYFPMSFPRGLWTFPSAQDEPRLNFKLLSNKASPGTAWPHKLNCRFICLYTPPPPPLPVERGRVCVVCCNWVMRFDVRHRKFMHSFPALRGKIFAGKWSLD